MGPLPAAPRLGVDADGCCKRSLLAVHPQSQLDIGHHASILR